MSATSSADSKAIYGSRNNTPGYGFGGEFLGGYRGVVGTTNNAADAAGSWGVSGSATGTAGTKIGVRGEATGAGTNYGVFGTASGGGTNFAGWFAGNVNITGSIAKGSGTFKIDHPDDPENKYLIHSFVESPDMMNIYNGNATTNAQGEAWVQLPEYFESLNKDFRYQLTVVGTFAQAIVGEKVQNGRFLIRTSEPNVEVSWQVTGIRKDPFAEKNRIVPVVEKTGEERGKYLYPELYGKTKAEGIGTAYEELVKQREAAQSPVIDTGVRTKEIKR
jgi:hypothetical protein